MKKILTVVLALCVLLIPAGCGTVGSSSGSGQTDDASTVSRPETVTLTFMRTGTPEVLHGIFDPMIAEFEKEYPHIKINMQDLGWADAEKTVQTMAASKTLPDLMYHLPGTIFSLAEKGLVRDLTPYVDNELKEDMFPAMMEAGKYDGKQYMITCGGSTIMLWYNAKLFEQAGLDPDNPPKTWAEFKDACKALAKLDGIDPLGLYAKSGGGETSFLFESLFTTEFGGSAWDGASNKYVYDSDRGKDAAINTLQFIKDITKYAQSNYVEYGRFDVRTLLRDGKVAMALDLFNMANQVTDQLEDGRIRCSVLPAGASGINSSAVNVGGWYIPVNSKHPDEAWTFLRYLMRTENQLAHATYGSVPMLKSETAFHTEGYMLQVDRSLDHSYAEGICPQTNALWTVTGEQLQLLMMGKQSAAETQAKIAKEHAAIH